MANFAYVFWHWPLPRVAAKSYEAKLGQFQSVLKSSKPDGLVGSLSYRVDSLPWAPKGTPLYEDWYVVESFSALGILNDAAVGSAVKKSHDSVAADYKKGAGGVFKEIHGGLQLTEARYATWVEKLIGIPYQSYYEGLAKEIGSAKTDLWRRQMVLGPSPQFCIHSERALDLPESFRPVTSKVRPLPSTLAYSQGTK